MTQVCWWRRNGDNNDINAAKSEIKKAGDETKKRNTTETVSWLHTVLGVLVSNIKPRRIYLR